MGAFYRNKILENTKPRQNTLTGFCFFYIWDKSHNYGKTKMTYEQLQIAISEKRQGKNNIAVEIDGEIYQGDFKIVFDDDRLDDGHIVITIKD